MKQENSVKLCDLVGNLLKKLEDFMRLLEQPEATAESFKHRNDF